MTLVAATSARSGQPLQFRHRTACAPVRQALPARALFGVFAPKPETSANRAQTLVNELLRSVEGTDGGLNASKAKRAQIEELVSELEGICPRNPLRSPLLFGEYEVLYASKPQTAGGPFRSPLGRTVFPGQRAVQRVQAPNIVVNEVSYRALGFIPGSACQEGEFTVLNNDTFLIEFPALDGKSKGGPPQRKIKTSYLDDSIRVARALPADDAEEGSFYVFRRLTEEVEEAAAPRPALGTKRIKAAVQEAQAEPGAGRSALGTRLLGRLQRDGLATIAEKRYAQQRSGSRGTGTASRAGTGSSGAARKSREELAAERAASRAAAEEERRAAREAAAALKAAAEEERRARQAQLEAERARLADVKEAARKRLADFQAEALEVAEDATAAAVATRDAGKAAASLIQQANQARGVIEQAANAATAALEELEGLKLAEKQASTAVADARSALKQLQAGRR